HLCRVATLRPLEYGWWDVDAHHHRIDPRQLDQWDACEYVIAWPDSTLRHQTLGSGAHREIVESRARRIQRAIALRLTCARLRQFSTAVRACSLLLCDRELGLRARSSQLQAGDCVFRGGGSFGDPELVRR